LIRYFPTLFTETGPALPECRETPQKTRKPAAKRRAAGGIARQNVGQNADIGGFA